MSAEFEVSKARKNSQRLITNSAVNDYHFITIIVTVIQHDSSDIIGTLSGIFLTTL